MADYKQCRECIKQDTCTFKILKSKEIDCQYFIDKDVVPRCEVEELKELLKVCKSCKEELAIKHGITVIELQLAKQDVAREIFEKLDDIRLNYYEGLYTEEQATEKYLELQNKHKRE